MKNPESDIEILTRLGLYFSVRHTARTMRLFADIFDYDYDCVIIFLSVGEVCFQAAFHLAPIEHGPAGIERIYSSITQSGLSVMTISEITGISRETVRRKVKKLVDDKIFALAPGGGKVYLPASVVTSDRFIDRFRTHLSEVGQFVRSVNFYERAND